MKILSRLLLTTFLTAIMCSCSNAAEKKEAQPTSAQKGAQQGMKTYYMGRFAIDVPVEFKLAVQSHRFRLIEIKEYPNIQSADQKWREYISKVEKMQKPKGASKISNSLLVFANGTDCSCGGHLHDPAR